MVKTFRLKETNVEGFKTEFFTCETKIGEHTEIIKGDEPYRCTMFTGVKIKLVKEDKYIMGIIHN